MAIRYVLDQWDDGFWSLKCLDFSKPEGEMRILDADHIYDLSEVMDMLADFDFQRR